MELNRNKQIEEMANILWHIPSGYSLNSYNDCEMIAESIYENGGYRKASEVAREICGMLREDLRGFVDADYLERLLTIYEKKYTEGEKCL